MSRKSKENMSLEMSELKKRYGNEIVRVVEASIVKPVLKNEWTPAEEAVFKVVSPNKTTITTPLLSSINLNMEDKLRYEAELDPAWKQVIGYCVIRKGKEYWVTHRLGKTGEQRLIGAYSLGTGGHAASSERVGDSIRRELEEEVGVSEALTTGKQLRGYILTESNKVSSVHLGIVYEVVVNTKDIRCLESEKLSGQWMTIQEIKKLYDNDELEDWSRIVFQEVLHE